MQALVDRFKNIQSSEASTVKLERLQNLLADIKIMYKDTFIGGKQDTLIEMKKAVNKAIEGTSADLDKAVATRRNYF